MKRLVIGLISLALLASSCAPAESQGTSLPVANSATYTPSPIPTSTITPTASITPLPTIPTFTPTFDVSTIVTVTPAPKAECPIENPSVVAKFATPNSNDPHGYIAPEILDYLNSGGTVTQLRDLGLAEIVDLNGDGVNEVVYRGIFRIAYIILGCKDGKYQEFLGFAGDSGAELGAVLDLNKNGNPDVILYNLVHYGYIDVSVFEWDGNKFHSLIDVRRERFPDEVIGWVNSTDLPKFIDTNRDGLKEIVVVFDVNQLCGGFGNFCDGTPAREQTTILEWNGQNYVVKQQYFSTAQYRFQVVQDGDIASTQKEYDKALSFYQEAIFSDNLKSYSPEIRDNLRAQFDAHYGTTPTPTTYPIALDEHPRLAAYVYYRIMLLHLVQGNESEATATYSTLQQTFSNDSYARPYMEMASAFWEAYQSTHKMYDGCAAAIQYAVEHPEILIPLGSDYHGWQAKIYKPEDVCPFR